MDKKASFQTLAKLLLFALTTGTKLVLRFRYRKAAIFWLPPGVFPYYMLWILSFSSSPLGSVSVGSWLFVVDSSIGALFGVAASVKKIWQLEAAGATAGPTPVKAQGVKIEDSAKAATSSEKLD